MRDEPQRVAIRHCQAGDDQLDRAVEQCLRLGAGLGAPRRGGDRRQCVDDPRGGRVILLEQQNAGSAGILGQAALALGIAEAPADFLAQPQLFHHALQADQRAHPREQRGVVDRFGQKLVGARFEAAQPIGDIGQRGHHDHRYVGGMRVGLEPAADLEPVHPRHHHVEQDDVGQLALGELQRRRAVIRGDHLEIFARQLGLEQLDVQFDVVDDQNSGGHGGVAPLNHDRNRSTVLMKLATEIGLAI